MHLRTSLIAAAGAALLAATLTGCQPPRAWHNELLTYDASGTHSANDASAEPVLSPDGTQLAFVSKGYDFGPPDDYRFTDVYLRDIATGDITMVSHNADGTGGGNRDSFSPVFSPDGTRIAFNSWANDLGPNDTNAGHEGPDIYLYDVATGTNALVSVNAAGTDSGSIGSNLPVFSPDGTRIAFSSFADDLVPADTNISDDVYLRDLTTGTTTLVSHNAAGTDSADGGSTYGTFTPDGGSLVFLSRGGDLGPVDTNGLLDLYERDLATGATTLLTPNASDTDGGNGQVVSLALSPDGTQLAFQTYASDLGPTDTNGTADLYVRDLTTGTTSLVSHNAAGTDSGNQFSDLPVFSPDSTRIAFASGATDLVPESVPVAGQLYLYDLATATTTLLSANTAGAGPDAVSSSAAFSPDGSQLAFTSAASDLGPTDTNGGTDLYVRNLATGRNVLVSTNADGSDGAGSGPSTPVFDATGRRLVFATLAGDLGADDANFASDVYMATFHAADLVVGLDAVPDPVASGGPLTYTLTVANHGPDPADDATAALLLPEGVSYDGATSSAGTCAAPPPAQPRLVVCQIGDLGDGDTVEVTVTVTADVTAPTGSTLIALASTRSTQVDVNNDDNTVTATSTVG